MASGLATSYQQAAALADAQERAIATRDYFKDVLLPYYGKNYRPVLQSCFTKVTRPDGAPFSFVAAIGADGRTMQMYNDHDTNIFLCLRESIKEGVFPNPPVSPYYLHIDMKFSDEPAPREGSGDAAPPLIVEPDKYSYTFGVPAGWEFSFEQAHQRGASLAFFPKGGSFKSSSSVIYVNEIDASCAPNCMKFVSKEIAKTIREVTSENPTAKVTASAPVTTKDGGTALVQILKGTIDPRDPKTGTVSEAVAFIGHDETIILVILTVRDTKTWDQNYRAFEQIITDHRFFNCNSPELRVPCSR